MRRADNAPPSSFALRAIALLDGLAAGRLDELARECSWRNHAEGEHIITREAKDREVYLLATGRVRITTYSASGRQVSFQDLAAGEIFGEVAALDGLPRSADVVALESSLVASMPTAVFQRLLQSEPALADRLLRRFARLVRLLTDRVVDLSTLGVQNRIHAELLRLAREAGIDGNRARIDPAPKHADIASQVSTYREQVTRELSALAKSGIVEKDRGALLVLDVQRLQQLVQEVRTGA